MMATMMSRDLATRSTTVRLRLRRSLRGNSGVSSAESIVGGNSVVLIMAAGDHSDSENRNDFSRRMCVESRALTDRCLIVMLLVTRISCTVTAVQSSVNCNYSIDLQMSLLVSVSIAHKRGTSKCTVA